MCNKEDVPKKRSNSFVNACFAIVTACIVILTGIAAWILISNHNSQNTSNTLIHDVTTSYDNDTNEQKAKNAINYYGDSTDISVINVDEQKLNNMELTLPEPSSLLDSIIYNLTLAVNAVNNVLTSGSILIAILTLFIALLGIFAYHDLKTDIYDKLESAEKDIDKAEDKREKYESKVDDKMAKAETMRNKFQENVIKVLKDTENIRITFEEEMMKNLKKAEQDRTDFEAEISTKFEKAEAGLFEFEQNLNAKISRIESFNAGLIAQERYSNKSISFLYEVISILAEYQDNDSIRNSLFHDYYIITLYRNELTQDSEESIALLHHKKAAALEYLKDKGTLDDIKDLETVAKYEPDEEIRNKTIEVIGIIKHRNNKS